MIILIYFSLLLRILIPLENAKDVIITKFLLFYCIFIRIYVLFTKPNYFSLLLNMTLLIVIFINLINFINFLYHIDSILESIVNMSSNDYSDGDPGPSTRNNNSDNNNNNNNNSDHNNNNNSNNNNNNNNNNNDIIAENNARNSDTDSNDSEPEYTRHRRALGNRTLEPGESQNLGRFEVMHVRDRARVQTLNMICIECQEAVANP